MSFGVGFGDIVLVSNGAIKIWTTIREAPAEQKRLTLKLELLRQSVHSIATLAPGLRPPITSFIEQQLSQCSEYLRDLDEIVTKYMGNCSPYQGSDGKRHRLLRQLWWGAKKRDALVQSLNELESLVVLLMSYAKLERLENVVPVSPSTAPGCEPLRLIDAPDREAICSISLCDTWERFDDFLQFTFKRSVGKAWVEAGRYQIRNESDGGILTAKEWEANIMAGMTVSMAMVLRKLETEENTCPSCATPYTGLKGAELERVRCKHCSTFFHISSGPRVTEFEVDDAGPSSTSGTIENTPLIQSQAVVDMDDLKYFRRLDVIQFSSPIGGDETVVPEGTLTLLALQAHQLLVANGIDPNRLTPQEFAAFQWQTPVGQQMSIHRYNASLAASSARGVSVSHGVGGSIQKGIPNAQQNPSTHAPPMKPLISTFVDPTSMMADIHLARD